MTSAAVETQTLPLRQRVAGEIRAQMARRGVRQLDLRPVLGLSQASINAKYNGKTPWSLDDIERLASFLQVSLADLMNAQDYRVNDESPRPVGGGSLFVLDDGGTASGTRTPNPLIKSLDEAPGAVITPLFAGLRRPRHAAEIAGRPLARVVTLRRSA